MSAPRSKATRAAAKVFTFKVGAGQKAKTYTLPNADQGVSKLTGRDLRDAALGGEQGQFAYLLKVLEAAGPDEAALEALYALPQQKMVEILGSWAEHGDGNGVTLGESGRSSS